MTAPLAWEDSAFLAAARTWIESPLAGLGLELAGVIGQPHVRLWSTVLRVPTAEGDVYFKAVAPIHRFEAALTGLLAELQPGRVPEVIAVDAERGWMLMRDGGTRLRELVETRADLHHWERLLPEYAQLQIEMTPQT